MLSKPCRLSFVLGAVLSVASLAGAAERTRSVDAHSYPEMFKLLSPDANNAKTLAELHAKVQRAFPEKADSASFLLANSEKEGARLESVALSEAISSQTGFREHMTATAFRVRNEREAIERVLQSKSGNTIQAFMELCGVMESGGSLWEVCTRYEYRNNQWVVVSYSVRLLTEEP